MSKTNLKTSAKGNNKRSHASLRTNGSDTPLYPPPLHVANVLAHLRILMRETDRCLSNVEADELLIYRLLHLKQESAALYEELASLYNLDELFNASRD